MTCFLLIRHGTTEHTGHILSGRAGVELNAAGREQAAKLARRLSALRPDVICSSPLTRCQQTAAPLAHAFDLELRTLPQLEELDYGSWEGKAWSELADDSRWQGYNQYRSLFRIPGGELLLEAQLRMMRALESLHHEAPDAVVALVSHGEPIRALLAFCLGMPLDMIHRLQVSTASISALSLNDGAPQVHCTNNHCVLEPQFLFG